MLSLYWWIWVFQWIGIGCAIAALVIIYACSRCIPAILTLGIIGLITNLIFFGVYLYLILCGIGLCRGNRDRNKHNFEKPETPEIPIGCYVGDGSSYGGGKTTTKRGQSCQNWASQSPHQHRYTPERYPGSDLHFNYCRNPDGSSEPWCYTTDRHKRWDFCGIPMCSDGYTWGTDGNYYKFHLEQLTWHAARDICDKEGAFLAMEKTVATHSYIMQSYQKNMWIGVTDKDRIGSDGVFLFVDGTRVQKTYWGKGEPNNFGTNEHCVETNVLKKGQWNDLECNSRRPFLCQRPTKGWREDKRCGPEFPFRGNPSTCNPNGVASCCSPHGWCGDSIDHCECEKCLDFSTYGHEN